MHASWLIIALLMHEPYKTVIARVDSYEEAANAVAGLTSQSHRVRYDIRKVYD